ncbi:MAG: S8 family serine peptidase [Candidatus Obscuribacterales bacterium]|nr:S8 family serine peptidase [Candidatus Obscuribacterales bacterium]
MKSRTQYLTALCCALVSVASNIASVSAFELKMPTKLPPPKRAENPNYSPDVLLIMPDAKLEQDDLQETMEKVHGTIVGELGEGDLKCYVVKTEKGHLEETEKTLSKDKKHFASVGRNYRIPCSIVPSSAKNPQFTSQWHLQAIHCPEAWNTATGTGTKIAVFDTGCEGSSKDLAGKTDKGFDAYGAIGKILGALAFVPTFAMPSVTEIAGMAAGVLAGSANKDTGANSHGTKVATTIAATMDNNELGVGVAPNSRIYPVRIAENKSPLDKDHQYTTDLEIIAGMINVMSHPEIRIVNISYGFPVAGFHNAMLHPVLHTYFKKFFYEPHHSGMIFVSAGNNGIPDPTPPVPYLCVVSAVDRDGKLADFSNWGPSVMFTAPGVEIGCSDKRSDPQTPNGTSFSAPIVAAVAALILDKKPMAPNVEILRTMVASCKKIKGAPLFTQYYGWGMPDAYAAVTGKDPKPPAAQPGNSPPSFNVSAGHTTRRAKSGSARTSP